MIICTNCGNHNADEDEFCGSCGKFLEWVGQKVEEPVVETPPEPEPEPEEVKVGLLDRVKAAVGMEGGADGAGASTMEAAAAPAATAGAGVAGAGAAAAGVAAPNSGPGSAPAAPAGPAGPASAGPTPAPSPVQEQAPDDEAATAAEAAAAEAAALAAAAAAEAEAEEARRRAEEEEAARRRRAEEEEAARRRQAEGAEAERRRLAEIAAAEAAAAARAKAEEEQRSQADAEAAAAKAEEEARQKAEAEAAAAAKAEEEARKKAEAEEAQRRQQEEERQRREAEARAEAARREAEARAEAARRAAALLAQPRAEAPAATSATPSAAPVKKAAGPARAAAPSATPAASTAPSAAPPVAPVAPAAPEARKAVAPGQEPARPKAPPKPATQMKVDEGPKPGDLICTGCGTGNDPTRKFCRRCGNSLAKAEPVKDVPWWKRLFARKPKQAKKAGGMTGRKAAREAQYRTRMVMATLRKALFALAALGIAVPFIVPSLRTSVLSSVGDGISSAREKLFPSFESVNAVQVAATSELPDHPASHAGDLAVNTYWAEGSPDVGLGQGLSFTFQGPQELARVIVTPGATDVAGSFLKEPRPKTVRLTFDSGGTQDITLKDELKAQTFTLKNAKGVSKVDVAIVDVYAGQGGQNTAIAEVEFKRKG